MIYQAQFSDHRLLILPIIKLMLANIIINDISNLSKLSDGHRLFMSFIKLNLTDAEI